MRFDIDTELKSRPVRKLRRSDLLDKNAKREMAAGKPSGDHGHAGTDWRAHVCPGRRLYRAGPSGRHGAL